MNYNPCNNIVSFTDACRVSIGAKSEGKKIVFTSGVFDILHSAHLHYLIHLKEKGDLLIVGIDNNVSAKKLKGEDHPFFDEKERAMAMSCLRFVDYVFIFEGTWEVDHLVRLKPDFVGVPPFDSNIKNKKEKIESAGAIMTVTPPFLSGRSSSRKANTMKSGYDTKKDIVEEVGE